MYENSLSLSSDLAYANRRIESLTVSPRGRRGAAKGAITSKINKTYNKT